MMLHIMKLYHLTAPIWNSVKDIVRIYLMPSICAYCKKFLSTQDIFCSACKHKIFRVVSKQIDITPSVSVTVLAISDYKDPLKRLILGKSWSDSLASHYMGQLMWDMLPLQELDCDIVVPIPLHWTRYAWRGFNQADEIARVISKKKNVPLCHVLKRIKKTEYQSALASALRGQNLKEAFALNETQAQASSAKHILLIDDLMTTGSTLRAAVKTLLPLKPKKITVAVVCRVV
jgi:ComF family protein